MATQPRPNPPNYVVRWRGAGEPPQEAPCGGRDEAIDMAKDLIRNGKALCEDVVIYEHSHIAFDVAAREMPRPAAPPLRG